MRPGSVALDIFWLLHRTLSIDVYSNSPEPGNPVLRGFQVFFWTLPILKHLQRLCFTTGFCVCLWLWSLGSVTRDHGPGIEEKAMSFHQLEEFLL